MNSLQLLGFQNGFAVADLGTTGKKLHGFRYQLSRMSDKAIFTAVTAAQAKQIIAEFS